jgi:F-type H+-transporting ATPase subunit alpha
MEVFKQPQYDPVPIEVQVAVLWAVQNGYVDQVPVERVRDFQTKATEFLTTQKVELLASIGREKVLSPQLNDSLKSAIEQFSQVWASESGSVTYAQSS